MMSKFSWGRVLDRFEYNFDGEVMNVVKYHPWKSENHIVTKVPDETQVYYHCEELRESASSLQYLLLAWMAYKNLGLNQSSLVHGVAKGLGVI